MARPPKANVTTRKASRQFYIGSRFRKQQRECHNKVSAKYALFVNNCFMKWVECLMKTVVKEAMGIEHYWGRVGFSPGWVQIHLNIIALSNDRAYLDDFYRAK